MRQWHHQLTHLHIHKHCSRIVLWKLSKLLNFITSLFVRFWSNFHCCSLECNFQLARTCPLKRNLLDERTWGICLRLLWILCLFLWCYAIEEYEEVLRIHTIQKDVPLQRKNDKIHVKYIAMHDLANHHKVRTNFYRSQLSNFITFKIGLLPF